MSNVLEQSSDTMACDTRLSEGDMQSSQSGQDENIGDKVKSETEKFHRLLELSLLAYSGRYCYWYMHDVTYAVTCC